MESKGMKENGQDWYLGSSVTLLRAMKGNSNGERERCPIFLDGKV